MERNSRTKNKKICMIYYFRFNMKDLNKFLISVFKMREKNKEKHMELEMKRTKITKKLV